MVPRDHVARLDVRELAAQRRPGEPARRRAVGDRGAVAAQQREPRAGPGELLRPRDRHEPEPARGEPDAPRGPRLGVVGRGRGNLGGLDLEDRRQAGGDRAGQRRQVLGREVGGAHGGTLSRGPPVRRARTSRKSWSVCLAGSTSAEGERSAPIPEADWRPGAWSAEPSVRVQARFGAQARLRLTSPPKMTVRVAARRSRSAASSAHCASFAVGARREVGCAHVDAGSRGDAQPPAPLAACLRLEVVAVAALDGRLGEHRVTEAPAAARPDTGKGLARDGHRREAQVIARPPGDLERRPPGRSR